MATQANPRIVAIQRRIGAVPDGFWGPRSAEAARHHLLRMMPQPNPWPRPCDQAMVAFYGRPGDEGNLVAMPVPTSVEVRYEGKPVKSIRCHWRVAESLGLILLEIGHSYPETLLGYAGCFNDRTMRGGTRASKHAWGVALDFWPQHNANHAHWPVGATMPIEVMEIWARHGWTAAGAFWSRDAMHFEATSPASD